MAASNQPMANWGITSSAPGTTCLGGRGLGRLKLVLVDSRTARVLWVDSIEAPAPTDVPGGDLMAGYGFRRLSRALATKFADMVVAQ